MTTLTVTRIGHACQLIEIGDRRILTDPWFTQTSTYYQGERVASTVAGLGRIDAVVVSHEHYDHCDLDALVDGGFDLGVPLVGPGTVAAIARDKGFRDVRAIEAWEATEVGDVRVTAAPPRPARRAGRLTARYHTNRSSAAHWPAILPEPAVCLVATGLSG